MALNKLLAEKYARILSGEARLNWHSAPVDTELEGGDDGFALFLCEGNLFSLAYLQIADNVSKREWVLFDGDGREDGLVIMRCDSLESLLRSDVLHYCSFRTRRPKERSVMTFCLFGFRLTISYA